MNLPLRRRQLLAKFEILAHLARIEDADARDIAQAFFVRYSVAAMALLRLVRQGLAERSRETTRGSYRYRLLPRGRDRLRYLQQQPGRGERSRSSFGGDVT
jgi:DNA-binding MarR family transcriptional regulator